MKCEEIGWIQFTSLAQGIKMYEHPVTVEVGEFVE
jgi:hypothetical protein